jgi:uncharacterized membrane protein YphA (DoxX/SURF4 family)
MYRLIRFALGGIFLWSGTNKLLEPQVFAVLIEAYGLVPDSLLMPIAIFLPILEVIAGLALMLDIRGSLATIGGLLIIFVTILGYGIHMGLDVDCGCFGPEDPEAKAYHGLRAAVYRDMLMMAGVFYLYAWRILRSQPPIRLKTLYNKIINRRQQTCEA